MQDSPPSPGAATRFDPAVLAPTVSRARYDREQRARREAEALLEAKSRELYQVNRDLARQAESLEQAVHQRTADLEAARAQADAASAAKSAFLANMSHEIRTPMNGVLAMAAELYDSSLTTDQREMLSIIISSGDLLMSVINDILDLSKVEAGRIEIEDVAFDLAEVVTSVERLHALKAQEKGITFSVNLRGAAWIRSDPTRLRQILGNLLSNAIKFTQEGSVQVTIDLLPGDAGRDVLRLEVRDTGIGMGADQLLRLFSPYEQGGSDMARRYGGTGLGLAISRHFCRLLGGDLWAESTPGRGSCFTGHLRVGAANPVVASDPDAASRALVDRLTVAPLHILAAEDNLTNQHVLTSILKRFDLRLEIVGNGRDAVQQWQRTRPDLILMDIQMPVMNGVEATAAIRKAEAAAGLSRTPIIAQSANAMRHHVEDYLSQGLDACVPKPLRRAELVEAILSVLPLLPSQPNASTRLDRQ